MSFPEQPSSMSSAPNSSPTSPPTGGGGGNNGGSSIATSASLYLYTFLATLVLLLSVSAAIVVRSFILRRRHRLMVEEAIRNGTWVPPSPPNSRSARVDLSKKPVLWEAYIDDKGTTSSWRSPSGDVVPHDHWNAEKSTDWDSIKPFSATYVSKAADGISIPSSPSTTSLRGNDLSASPSTAAILQASPSAASPVNNPRVPRHRAVFARALAMLSPTPAPTSPLPAPVTSGMGQAALGTRDAEHAMAELQQRSTAPNVMCVAVLIAMPKPPTTADSHSQHGADEHPLPHLEVGVAEVTMVPTDPSTSYARGKREARDSVASRESDASV